ncbi:hypothetical protein [Micromonospora halophytica]|nr:hypothetical protein [Micromonospora halophytica]
MTNGSRPTSESRPNPKNQTALKSTECGPACGPCWETFCGDERCCEVFAVRKARRDLAEMLAGGGDRG